MQSDTFTYGAVCFSLVISAYAYTRASMGVFAGWLIGWDLILEYTVAAAAVSQSWSHYFKEFLGLFSVQIPHVIASTPFGFDGRHGTVLSTHGAIFDLPALLIALLIMTLVVCGVKDSARFNDIMVTIKVSVVLFVIVLGAILVDPANWTPFAPFGYAGLAIFGRSVVGQATPEGGAAGVIAGAALVYFSYIGFDSVSTLSEEARKPARDLPVGIILSLAISTVLYMGVCLVLTGMVPWSEIDMKAPVSAVFGARGYAWAQYLVAIGALVGMTSVLLVSMMGQPRIFMAMARDGLLPPSFFADIHPRFKTPWKATLLTGSVVGILACLIPLQILVEFVSIGTLLAFTFVCISVLVLRRTAPHVHRPFRCPWVPFVPVLGASICIMLMLSLPTNNWYRLLAWFALGMCIYFFYGRKYAIREHHHFIVDEKNPCNQAREQDMLKPGIELTKAKGDRTESDHDRDADYGAHAPSAPASSTRQTATATAIASGEMSDAQPTLGSIYTATAHTRHPSSLSESQNWQADGQTPHQRHPSGSTSRSSADADSGAATAATPALAPAPASSPPRSRAQTLSSHPEEPDSEQQEEETDHDSDPHPARTEPHIPTTDQTVAASADSSDDSDVATDLEHQARIWHFT